MVTLNSTINTKNSQINKLLTYFIQNFFLECDLEIKTLKKQTRKKVKKIENS